MKKIILTILVLFISSLSYSQSGNLKVTYMRDIEFQQIIPGSKKTITEMSPYAGKFIITGDGTKMTVSVNFNLSQGISTGSKIIPVKYTATQSFVSNDSQPGIPFDPYAGTTISFDDKTKEYYIKLGRTLSTQYIQSAGNYSSPVLIILTIVSN